MELNFASTFISSSIDQVLAESTTFPIELNQIVNQTDPLSSDGLPTFGGIWSYSLSVDSDQLFTNQSRYTFFYRTQTNISISIEQNIFYVSNLQQPIARQTEVIFHSLLLTIVVLEMFGLIFLLVKLLFIPLFRTALKHLRRKLSKSQDTPLDDLSIIEVKNNTPPNVTHQNFANARPLRRWSTIAMARKVCHD
jgi:hypothetical protein